MIAYKHNAPEPDPSTRKEYQQAIANMEGAIEFLSNDNNVRSVRRDEVFREVLSNLNWIVHKRTSPNA